MPKSTESTSASWPGLPLRQWQDTYDTLHLWTQIIGKVRLALAPPVNHWWGVTLYVTARGLTTSPIPYGRRAFEVNLDFIDHALVVNTSDGDTRSLPLSPRPVAEFYAQFMGLMRSLGFDIKIWPVPVEMEGRTPFDKDVAHASYDPESAHRFWQVMVQTDRVFKSFRSRFIGKCSPVHFFWGGFDMAVTRFSGRRAPEHPPVPNVGHFVAIEAYTHEVSSAGFWPGGGPIQEPAYYSYAYPEPEDFKYYRVRPSGAFYSREMGEFILPYEAVRRAKDPDKELIEFLQSTYEAAAETGRWDRTELERAEAWPFAA